MYHDMQAPFKVLQTCMRMLQTQHDLATRDGLTAAAVLLSKVTDDLQLGSATTSLATSLTAQMQRSGLLQALPGMLDDTARKLHAAADPAGMQDTSASTQGISINTVGNSSSSSLSMGSAGNGQAEASTAPTAGSSGSGSTAGPANPQHAQLCTVQRSRQSSCCQCGCRYTTSCPHPRWTPNCLLRG